MKLTDSQRGQIAEILGRRANDIASFKTDLEKKTGQKFEELPGSVEMALTREIERLRKLQDLVKPEEQEDDES